MIVEALPIRSHGLFLGRSVLSLTARTICRHIVVEERPEHLLDTILPTEFSTSFVADPRSLVFAVAALDLLVLANEDLFL